MTAPPCPLLINFLDAVWTTDEGDQALAITTLLLGRRIYVIAI